MKKSRTTRSHFTHARSCSRALNQVPTRAKRTAFIRTYSLWKIDIFLFDRLTGYKKSNQNQIWRVLPFPFASGSIFSSLLALMLINSANAYILVMAWVDCARAGSQKPFRASLKCYLNPWITHWVLALVEGIREPHEVKKSSFDLGGNRTHDLRIRSTVTLPTELWGRTEKVGDDRDGESRRRESKGTYECCAA